jgi:ADP-heptose:LPS heptosyltransferase|tara:strand:+ start:4466 stop:5428 length:963 start_codon:yes stop_codon:yes gene_type:complete
MTRSTAFFVNGGAGRHICSIPAFEKYEAENPDDDFIIVCEGGMDMYKGHPTLHARSYDNWHKNLFQDKIKDRNCVTTEPYRVWEYYNQKANLVSAFDIQVNDKGLRDLPDPTLYLTAAELIQGQDIIDEVREKTKKEKVIVFQPYGRSTQPMGSKGQHLVDSGGRSFALNDTIKLIKKLQKKYAVVLFSEFQGDWSQHGITEPVAQPEGAPLRIWASAIKAANGFLGCDSVGQHFAYSTKTPSVTVLGSTYQENVSYPDNDIFQVLDLGHDRRRYDPIRISFEEEISMAHEGIMMLSEGAINEIAKELDMVISKGAKNEK